MKSDSERQQTVRQLMTQLRKWEGSRSAATDEPDAISTGWQTLDQLIPAGGLLKGTLVEWLHAGEGNGATSIALDTAAAIIRQERDRIRADLAENGGPQNSHRRTNSGARSTANRRDLSGSSAVAGKTGDSVTIDAVQGQGGIEPPVVVVIDPARKFYPPAWARRGMSLRNVVVVHPENERETVWAWEQALQTPGVAVAICWMEHVSDRVYRRLQLAAQKGQSIGQLIRTDRWRNAPSWAELRFLVSAKRTSEEQSARQRRLNVELIYCRGWFEQRSVTLSLADVNRRDHSGEDGQATA